MARMLRVWRPSGQELAVENAAALEDVAAVKQFLSEAHGFPVYLQQLVQGGSVLADDTKLEDHVELQLVLLPIHGCSPNLKIRDLAASDLATAAALNRVKMVQCLLEAGAEKDCWDEDGWTALMWSSLNGHLEVARVLLEAGACKDFWTNTGMTALNARV